jgi:twitching motility protein PilT
VGCVLRLVGDEPKSLAELALPDVIRSLAREPRGLVLVTGPTGSGKTTTLAAMVDAINETRAAHILTIEDPIEVIHRDKVASVNQRELGTDTADWSVALRAAMRQDPDVILIGEMRDADTVRAGLAAAETGHFVMSTLHTTDAKETINRVIDFFPPHEQKQVRLGLAASLRGIVCQRLVPRADGGGRVVAMEIAVNTPRLAEAVADPERTDTIPDVIADGSYSGMQTFDQHLVRLVLDGSVSVPDAKLVSSNTHDFSVMLKRAGVDPALVDGEPGR